MNPHWKKNHATTKTAQVHPKASSRKNAVKLRRRFPHMNADNGCQLPNPSNA